jgi:hypothetical protein
VLLASISLIGRRSHLFPLATAPLASMDRYHVHFQVAEFGSVAEVSGLMGIEPTKAWAKGDPMPRPGRPPFPRPFSRWELAAPAEPTAEFEDQLEALLTLLEANASGIAKVMQLYPCFISCVTGYEHFNPGFQLSTGHLMRIAQLGLSMDFDLYFLPPESNDDAWPAALDSVDEDEGWRAARARMRPYVSAVFWQDLGIGGDEHDRSVDWMLDRIFRPEFFGATSRPVWRVMRDADGNHTVVGRGFSRSRAAEILKQVSASGDGRFHWMEPMPDDQAG